MENLKSAISNSLEKYKCLIKEELHVTASELLHFVINRNGIITYTNNNFQKLTNYYSFELELKFYDKLNYDDLYIPSICDVIKKVSLSKAIYFGKLNIKKKDLNIVCLKTIFIPVLNKKEKILKYICFSSEPNMKTITKVNNHKIEDHLLDVYKYMNENVNQLIRIDLNKNITYANDLFYTQNSYKKEEILNKSYLNIIENTNKKYEIDNIFHLLSTRKTYKTIITKTYKNVINYFLSIYTAILNKSEEIIEYLNIQYDITSSYLENTK